MSPFLLPFLFKRGTQKVARFHSLRKLRPYPPTDHIHQITTVTQRDGEQFRKVGLHEGVAADFCAKRVVFQHLRDRANTVIRHGLQSVEWGLGADEQEGRDQVDSG